MSALEGASAPGVDAVLGCQCDACRIRPHASDCAVHNMPAYPNGPCNCERPTSATAADAASEKAPS